jgi:hypothetical protein
MSSDKRLPKASDVECMTITIVGVLGPITKANEAAEQANMQGFMEAIRQAIFAFWPDFQPGYPPVAITTVTLPELRSNDAEST